MEGRVFQLGRMENPILLPPHAGLIGLLPNPFAPRIVAVYYVIDLVRENGDTLVRENGDILSATLQASWGSDVVDLGGS